MFLFVFNIPDDPENDPTLTFLPENLWNERLDELIRISPVSSQKIKTDDFINEQIGAMTFRALAGTDDQFSIHIPKSFAKSPQEAIEIVAEKLSLILKIIEEDTIEELDDRYIVFLETFGEWKIITPDDTLCSNSRSFGPVEYFLTDIGPFTVSKIQFLEVSKSSRDYEKIVDKWFELHQ
jgi:hypothetical protein